eukprot:Rhum_TRINITY_DN5965_c0_g1::Rhum_TRINITY_DN5965_c0_g1_i1::g.18840::m.18840
MKEGFDFSVQTSNADEVFFDDDPWEMRIGPASHVALDDYPSNLDPSAASDDTGAPDTAFDADAAGATVERFLLGHGKVGATLGEDTLRDTFDSVAGDSGVSDVHFDTDNWHDDPQAAHVGTEGYGFDEYPNDHEELEAHRANVPSDRFYGTGEEGYYSTEVSGQQTPLRANVGSRTRVPQERLVAPQDTPDKGVRSPKPARGTPQHTKRRAAQKAAARKASVGSTVSATTASPASLSSQSSFPGRHSHTSKHTREDQATPQVAAPLPDSRAPDADAGTDAADATLMKLRVDSKSSEEALVSQIDILQDVLRTQRRQKRLSGRVHVTVPGTESAAPSTVTVPSAALPPPPPPPPSADNRLSPPLSPAAPPSAQLHAELTSFKTLYEQERQKNVALTAKLQEREAAFAEREKHLLELVARQHQLATELQTQHARYVSAMKNRPAPDAGLLDASPQHKPSERPTITVTSPSSSPPDARTRWLPAVPPPLPEAVDSPPQQSPPHSGVLHPTAASAALLKLVQEQQSSRARQLPPTRRKELPPAETAHSAHAVQSANERQRVQMSPVMSHPPIPHTPFRHSY